MRTLIVAALAAAFAIGTIGVSPANADTVRKLDGTYVVTPKNRPNTITPGKYVCVGYPRDWTDKRAAGVTIQHRWSGKVIWTDFDLGQTARVYFRLKKRHIGKVVDLYACHARRIHRHG